MLWLKLLAVLTGVAYAFCQILLDYFLHDRRTRHHKRARKIIAATVMISLLAAAWGVYVDDQSQADMKRQMTFLREELRKARLEANNRDQLLRAKNEQLLAKSDMIIGKTETIADLRRELGKAHLESIEQITGGDSYCYASFHQPEGGTARIFVVQSGSFPLYDVQMQIVDLQKFEQVVERAMSLERAIGARITLDLGNLSAGTSMLRPEMIRFSGTDQQDFNIFFVARNGAWSQLVRLRRIDDRWVAATRVLKGSGKNTKVLREKVDENFPRGAGGAVPW